MPGRTVRIVDVSVARPSTVGAPSGSFSPLWAIFPVSSSAWRSPLHVLEVERPGEEPVAQARLHVQPRHALLTLESLVTGPPNVSARSWPSALLFFASGRQVFANGASHLPGANSLEGH